jgi:DNA-binding NarL/FixJ family response regulator
MAGVIVEEDGAVPEQEPVRVLVVVDDPSVPAETRRALHEAPELSVVGEVESGSAAGPAAARALDPDVVLMSLTAPDGLAAIEELRARPGAPEVIVLTRFGRDDQVLRALRAGAAGFLLADAAAERVVAAVRRVACGEPMLSAQITRRLIDYAAPRGRPARRDEARQALAALTPREREVAAAVAEAHPIAEIAAQLHLSVAAVQTHLGRVLAKLDLNSRVQLALLMHDAED